MVCLLHRRSLPTLGLFVRFVASVIRLSDSEKASVHRHWHPIGHTACQVLLIVALLISPLACTGLGQNEYSLALV